MKTRHHPNYGWILLIAVAVGILATPVSAQFHTSKVSVPDDLVVRQHLTRAQDALEQGDAPRAIRTWQDILDRLSGKVVESHRAARMGTETDAVIDGDRFQGVRDRVMELIRALPGQGLLQYRKMMEPKARRLLADGIAKEDEGLLRECARRYLLTDSGRGAHFALIDLLIEHGRFEEARVAAKRLRHNLTAAELAGPIGIQILAREGLALWGAGRMAELEQTVTIARENANGKDIAVGADQVDVVAFLEALADRVATQRTDSPQIRPEIKVVRQRIWNRAFLRNTDTSGSTPMFGGRSRSHWVNHFPVVPNIKDGVVYYCDGRFLRARSLFTGNELWPGIPSLLPEFSGQQNRNLHYHSVVDDDLVFSYVQGKPAMEGQRAWQGFEPIETIPAHKLIAVDRNTGEVRWSHMNFTGRTPDETAFIERLTINQPPLVIGDTLYAAGNVLMGVFHQWICAFDRGSGQIKWKTYTGAGQMELNMFGNPVKEGVPGHVAEHEGVLYYSTNIGVICAVDAVTGTIIWESAYVQEGIPSTDSPITRERHPGWMPSRPAIVGDKVFIAPTDSMNLYACAKDTGELSRVGIGTRTATSKNHYFLGEHGGLLLVAGRKITAIRPDDFGEEWSSVELGSQYDRSAIQGAPTVIGNDIVFCTATGNGNANHINRVDLRNGSFVQQERMPYANREGNVVVSSDAIVIAGQQSIDAYFDLEDVERRLDQASRLAGSDPELQMRLGDVRQRQGQWAQALKAYQKALERARATRPRGRHIARRAALNLYNGWLKMAEEQDRRVTGGPVNAEARFHKAIEYAQTEKQHVRALMACLDWSLRENDEPAFNRTVTLIAEGHAEEWTELNGEVHGLFPELPQGTRMPAGLLALLAAGARADQSDRHRDAVKHFHHAQTRYAEIPIERQSAWHYAGDKIQRIIKIHGKSVYQAMEQKARRLLTRAIAGNDMQGIRTVLRHYPQSSVVEKAYLELSRRLLEKGKYREALGEMQRYFTRFGHASAAALYEYARCLEELQAYDSYADVVNVLMRRHGDAVLRSAGESVRVRGWAKAQLAREEVTRISKAREAPAIDKGLRVAWTKPAGQGGEEAWIVSPLGAAARGCESLVFAHLNRELVALTPRDGQVVWRKASVAVPMFPSWHDGSLVVALDGDVVALNPKTGAERWRTRPEAGDLRDLIGGHGKVYLLIRSVAQGGLIVKGLDGTSGEEVQSFAMRGFYDGTLSASPGWLLVRTPRQRKATCFDGYTGNKVGATLQFQRDGQEPFLTKQDKVVLSFGSERAADELVRIVARDPATGQDAWQFEAGRGNFIPLMLNDDYFAFELRAATTSSRRGERSRHKVVVLDLEKGEPRFVGELETNEFSIDAVISGDRLYLGVMASVKTGTGIAQKIRAYDMRKGTSPWSTAEFSGSSIRLWAYPTKDWVLVRKSAPRRSRTRRGNAPELYFIDARTGRVDDLVELTRDTAIADSPGMVVREETLVISTGTELKGWIK